MIRNPFRKQDENARPLNEKAGPGTIDIKQPTEYKLSGSCGQRNMLWSIASDVMQKSTTMALFFRYETCLPASKHSHLTPPQPSPMERNKNFWSSRSNGSTTSSNPKSIMSPDEPFNISRESFDSYRRSFVRLPCRRRPLAHSDQAQDITARSPVVQQEGFPRASLDSRMPAQSRMSSTFQRPEPTQEEDFEDVGLNDEAKPKKRGFFGRFGDANENAHPPGHHGFHIGGRKRGQSGTGQELGDMNNRPGSSSR